MTLIDGILSLAVVVQFAALWHVAWHLHGTKQVVAVLLHALVQEGVIEIEESPDER